MIKFEFTAENRLKLIGLIVRDYRDLYGSAAYSNSAIATEVDFLANQTEEWLQVNIDNFARDIARLQEMES